MNTSRAKDSNLDIFISDRGTLVKDERKGADILAKHFSSIANNIGNHAAIPKYD